MKHTKTILALLSFAVGSLGCWVGYGDCSGVSERSDELRTDLDRIDGTTSVFEVSNERGSLRVELAFEADDPPEDGWLAKTPHREPSTLESLSNLVIPPAHATSCVEPGAYQRLTYTVVWSPSDGEARTLHQDEWASGQYLFGAYDQYVEGQPRSMIIDDGDVTIRLISRDGQARTLELVYFYDGNNTEANTQIWL